MVKNTPPPMTPKRAKRAAGSPDTTSAGIMAGYLSCEVMGGQRRFFRAAAIGRHGAARGKGAAGRQVEGAGQFALQRRAGAAAFYGRIGHRHGVNERLGIGMARIGEDLL